MLQYAREARALTGQIDFERFREDRTLQLAVAYLIQIVGEAASRTNAQTRTALSNVPWAQIVGMRLVHNYGNVDFELEWDVVSNDLPGLIAALEKFTPPEPPSA